MQRKIPKMYFDARQLDEKADRSNFSSEKWKAYYLQESKSDCNLNHRSDSDSAFNALFKYMPGTLLGKQSEQTLDALFFDSLAMNQEFDMQGISWNFVTTHPTDRGKPEKLGKNEPFAA